MSERFPSPSYRIRVERTAAKALARRIRREDAERIRRAIDGLAADPLPQSIELRGREGRRLRVGDYRVLYEVDDDELVVTVLGVGHRRDVYR
ncbi:MAG: type II toxin-antitoxin system RelE/ParE family toxin [Actinomycetota bacterium]|nr:type II toxin-antitoxin system RelE/ParE family toxin [Actinomycetota bacterium]